MPDIFKRIFHFIIFRNVFIASCAVCMVWETQWYLGIAIQVTPLVLFVFFATFFEYNLHVISGRISLLRPLVSVHEIFYSEIPIALKICIISGSLGSLVLFFLLGRELMAGFLIAGLLTLSYSLPMIKRSGKFIRMREITYLKIFTVAFGWTLITVIIPLLPFLQSISKEELIIIFLRRFLFIYAITIPFEIRDMERERRFGNVSLPMIYGVKNMKAIGITMLVLFCILCTMQEKYFLFDVASRKSLMLPLLISAASAGMLILNASDQKSGWYFKFWTDGTMILQFLLLLLFNQ